MKTFSIVSALILASAFGGTAFASERDTPAGAQITQATSVLSRAEVTQEAVAANAAQARGLNTERAPFVYISQIDKPATAQPLSRMAVREDAIKSAHMVADFDGLYSRS